MITFTIKDGEIVNTKGVPSLIIRESDYETFYENREEFERRFPNKLFGCVKSTDATYNLSEENRVNFSDNRSLDVGVYYGVCEQ